MLTYRGNDFYLNDRKFRILSGAVHYFRMPEEKWKDIIHKAKLMGLNTVETYIPWNVHEPERGKYCFEGMYDLCAFLDAVKEEEMYAIVRPSPYICAEWEFGGLPAWLLKDENIRLRCMDETYLEAVSDWYEKLIPMLAAYTMENGGPIIAAQIENEYGSYGNDHNYINWMKKKMESLGLKNTFLFTADGPEDFMLQGGSLPGVFKAVNFGSNAAEAYETVKRYQPDAPFFCGEFWNGWFNHWGEPDMSRERSDEDCVKELEEILKRNGSVNLYMFYGGTSFGFMAGANMDAWEKKYQPDTTSYDYGAPLDESGNITEKYLMMRECISRYAPVPDEELPLAAPAKNYGEYEPAGSVSLFDCLEQIGDKHLSPVPYSMEHFGQSCGYILYRTRIEGPRAEMPVVLQEVRDRAQVFADGKLLGVIDRDHDQKLPLEVKGKEVRLDVLVENLGRINYGPYMKDRKGISEGIRHGQQFQFGYEIYCLPMEHLEKLRFHEPEKHAEPAFYQFSVSIDECLDTYLDMGGWTKGFVAVNGFLLGRYWNAGPQTALYLPKELLRKGENSILVFEEEESGKRLVFAEKRPE
ncbi:MAG TPA: beta-galactosidase [Candidatus Eisenbergiella merdipullorum]|uniref:Beta-galactosidase n=1 Tax=Candidatus Eisenbergiella merdipullorum TaxID=2838553 RepID=A0A9D2I7F6_9FIRM|nr:beta-galactosidase [Candidatus Eisenbergiella merdipullorum]